MLVVQKRNSYSVHGLEGLEKYSFHVAISCATSNIVGLIDGLYCVHINPSSMSSWTISCTSLLLQDLGGLFTSASFMMGSRLRL